MVVFTVTLVLLEKELCIKHTTVELNMEKPVLHPKHSFNHPDLETIHFFTTQILLKVFNIVNIHGKCTIGFSLF